MHDNSTSTSGKIRYIEVDRGYDTPCWEWQMSIHEKGYGQLRVNGKTQRAHRYFYELVHGTVESGMNIDHLCRNRACVNPEHLEAVTTAENIRRGDVAKLTMREAEEIRALKGVESAKEVANRFGVVSTTIYRIWNGKRWAKDAA